jgi:hypothetical protein
MKTTLAVVLALCGLASMAAAGENGGTTKITGGGQAVGTVLDICQEYNEETGDVDVSVDELEGVRATVAAEVWYKEEADGYVGGGNLQFVDHETGECFHVDITIAGPPLGLGGGEDHPDYDVFAIGWLRDCGARRHGCGGNSDEVPLTVDIWLADGGENGPDRVLVARQRYVPPFPGDDDGYDYLGYVFEGELKKGSLKLH